ncbi:Rrf2 family transcriptional regulator [Paenibacillus pinistramenti]|uniref:Rrf2 family transcriptional regulator n=1 Tax=Paenibacillus pinistramenti TaxID=1768003 RepID=UPI00110828C4|nr:Rrf2 family transcriptional regulator [Paenibacillus pinistramenti]
MSVGWFPIAVHALALLSTSEEGYSSAYIASSVNTHSVFLRRVLAKLVKSGLLETKEGSGGGYRLVKPAHEITLAEVYRSLEGDSFISLSPAEPNENCPVGSGIRPAFQEVISNVDRLVLQQLEDITIDQVAESAILHGKQKNANKQ